MQSLPASMEPSHRLQLLFLWTGTRLGFPSVLPIKDGVGPLGILLFVFAFGLSYSTRQNVYNVI